LEALETCEVMAINARKLLVEAVQHDDAIASIFKSYGRAFHKRLTDAKPPRSNWPNDLHVPFTDYEEIIASMALEYRSYVGVVALDVTAKVGRDSLCFRVGSNGGSKSKL